MTDPNADLLSAVEEAKKLDTEATPGPWQYSTPQAKLIAPESALLGIKTGEALWGPSYGPKPLDGNFIARSRTLLPLLASGVERLVEENAALRTAIEIDAFAWRVLQAIHAGIPEDKRPTSWSDFSSEQLSRIESAMIALITLSKVTTGPTYRITAPSPKRERPMPDEPMSVPEVRAALARCEKTTIGLVALRGWVEQLEGSGFLQLTAALDELAHSRADLPRALATIQSQSARIAALAEALADMLAWAESPSAQASPSWIVGSCSRARALTQPERPSAPCAPCPRTEHTTTRPD